VRKLTYRVLGFLAFRLGFEDTLSIFLWDAKRWKARRRTSRMMKARYGVLPDRLHLGCGSRLVNEWLNVDIANSDVDVDLAAGYLPFSDGSFVAVCSQQTIEHLVLESELMPLLDEVFRVLAADGELWLSCPDMEKVALDYVNTSCDALVQDRARRMPRWSKRWKSQGWPSSHFMNEIFHQSGEHKNLFDYSLLAHVLGKSGFKEVERASEEELLSRFPGFPPRGDNFHALYVRATK